MPGDHQVISRASPSHAGEVELQRQTGAAERMDAVGRKVVRDFMPDQHRDFFAQLPFIVVGAVDREGDVWATLAEGEPGFVTSPDPRTLRISAMRDGADPADSGVGDGADVGLLGIELHTRRRNRMNGRLRREGADRFTVSVEQSFGNCAKYIQLRDFSFAAAGGYARPAATELNGLDGQAREMIQSADTFFVASYAGLADGRRQVDVSHRGGKPGFVRIDESGGLTIPDFAGNHFFNTLGNILANGRAGLLFIDFETGDLLQLTGDAEVILDSPEIAAFEGCERAWTVRPRRMVYRAAATGLRWSRHGEWLSPFSRKTGSWPEPRMPSIDA
ncbi:MAG TPA: pyridoxamine 5'-phosphate oxidase family protein [Hyphomicrobiaceae bacterium]|nr:pyridoxamine 5'-phosphate oxidase family protein [Hyphomicrobiaceae bacterium]